MGLLATIAGIKTHTTAIGDTICNCAVSLPDHMKEEAINFPDLPQSVSSSYFLNDPEWSIYGNLTIWSIIFGIAVALILIVLRFLLKRISDSHRDFSLKIAFLAVWVYGFIVYDVGMFTGEYISLLTNAPMAILYAFRIFVFNSDVSEIQNVFHESWFYSMNFALVHFLAAIISTLFVIKYFGFNLLAQWQMFKTAWRNPVDDTYVVWGLNDASAELVKSIQRHYQQPSVTGSYRIVIIRLNTQDDDNPETRTGVGRIFEFLSVPPSELQKLKDLDCLKDLHCLTTGTYSSLSAINSTEDYDYLIKRRLNLRSLNRILKKKTDKKIHMLFLGDNEKENIHAVSVLLKDKMLRDFAYETAESEQAKHEVIFYCHARYNSVHRVIEDRYMSGQIRVKIIDSSHISIEELKLNEDLLPVNYVKIEKDGSVSSSFNSLVVGFSEIGQDAVKFLYEYGAFVKTGSTDSHVERSLFHVNVVDRDMSDMAGAFVAGTPAIKPSIPFIEGMENPKALITLLKMDCRSIEFYHELENWVKTLNYVVIATEDDELNITLAVRIFKLAARYRDDIRRFVILTRVQEDEDGHIRNIAEYYNRLWAAQEAVENYDGKIAVQGKVKRDSEAKMPIHIFGLAKETYTYHNIIDDSTERLAVEFKERYEASTAKGYIKPESPDGFAWRTQVNKNIKCPLNDENNHPTYSAVIGIRRMQGQDMANCFHSHTKSFLAKEALKAAGLPEEFRWDLLSRVSKTTTYRVKAGNRVAPQIFDILKVLAQTEHLRWNASHELLGYVGGGKHPSRDEIRMRHSCLTDWQNLEVGDNPDEIQSYDYDVVDMTLNIINPDKPIEQE